MLQPFLRDGESSLQIRKQLDLGSDFFFFMNDRDQNHADWMMQMLPINSNQWLSMIDSRSVVIYIRLSIYFFHGQSYHRNLDGKGSTHPFLLRARYKKGTPPKLQVPFQVIIYFPGQVNISFFSCQVNISFSSPVNIYFSGQVKVSFSSERQYFNPL